MKSFTMLLALVLGTVDSMAYTGFSHPPYKTTRPPMATLAPETPAIYAEQAAVRPSSPMSDVKGHVFDRIVQIWLENVDYHDAAANAEMQWIASQGIRLDNFWAVTHPSQPNYAASVAGDYFGMDEDYFVTFPANISTVVDLLDTRAISWGEYQEHLPYAGFAGWNFSNQETEKDDYVRKHNPLIMFESVALNETRALQIKNFTSFYQDLADQKLPQWSFVTPNMTNDAHDTNITFGASWTRRFLEPLLIDPYFAKDTLIIVSFDENDTYRDANKIFTVLLGGAVPHHLAGTTDSGFYNHYSTLATVSANWDLPSLGRWDCGANVFTLVAKHLPWVRNMEVDTTGFAYNVSYPGAVADVRYTPGWWPMPNTLANCTNGRGVLPAIVEVWGEGSGSYGYGRAFPADGFTGMSDAEKEVMWERQALSQTKWAAKSISPVQVAKAAQIARAVQAVKAESEKKLKERELPTPTVKPRNLAMPAAAPRTSGAARRGEAGRAIHELDTTPITHFVAPVSSIAGVLSFFCS